MIPAGRLCPGNRRSQRSRPGARPGTCQKISPMPVVILTGATRGIGEAAAIALAARGAELALVGRDPTRVRAAAEKARTSGGEAPVREYVADLTQMGEVRRLAAELLEGYPRIDVLANNAGAMFTSRHVTTDGFEQTFALNHLAPFLLTNLLLERISASSGRVVTTASDAHKGGLLDLAAASAPGASTARPSSATSSSRANCSGATRPSRPTPSTPGSSERASARTTGRSCGPASLWPDPFCVRPRAELARWCGLRSIPPGMSCAASTSRRSNRCNRARRLRTTASPPSCGSARKSCPHWRTRGDFEPRGVSLASDRDSY